MSGPAASTALAGLVVIDLTRARAGPTCVRQFADWGASVVKVEMRETDPSNSSQADFSARHDPDFQNLHRNKRSLAIDLKHPDGQRIFRRLVERADIVVENYRPDVKFRLGIDYESMKAVNPRLIYASISGFGQEGPYRDRPGVDQIAQGMTGLMSITGEPGGGPIRAGIALTDLSAGLFAALGVMVALLERQRSGEGQWVQTSLLQAGLFMLDFQGSRYTMTGDVPKQVGNNHPTGVPTGTYRTRDGHVNIAPTPAMWRRFSNAIGRPQWIEDPDFATAPVRRKNRDRIHAMIEEITAQQPTATWIETFNAAGIPCGPIYDIGQAFNDPQVKLLGIVQQVLSGALGAINLIGQPVTLSRTRSKLATSAPEYGEHADAILAELGYSSADIAAFREAGAI
ncbi:MAG TPA: CoA transferase [Stellaceae bacterium]|nr:CoA transferase [Stellaceae bacterium]